MSETTKKRDDKLTHKILASPSTRWFNDDEQMRKGTHNQMCTISRTIGKRGRIKKETKYYLVEGKASIDKWQGELGNPNINKKGKKELQNKIQALEARLKVRIETDELERKVKLYEELMPLFVANCEPFSAELHEGVKQILLKTKPETKKENTLQEMIDAIIEKAPADIIDL